MLTRLFEKVRNAATIALGVALLGVMLAPGAKAADFTKKTFVTIDKPIEIPGKVLSAGTYVFKIADPDAGQNLVMIYDKDEKHLVTTLLAIPAYRMEPTSEPEFKFEERSEKSPLALHIWFNAGDNRGYEFRYPAIGKTLDTEVGAGIE